MREWYKKKAAEALQRGQDDVEDGDTATQKVAMTDYENYLSGAKQHETNDL